MSGVRRRGPLSFRFIGNFSEIPYETKRSADFDLSQDSSLNFPMTRKCSAGMRSLQHRQPPAGLSDAKTKKETLHRISGKLG